MFIYHSIQRKIITRRSTSVAGASRRRRETAREKSPARASWKPSFGAEENSSFRDSPRANFSAFSAMLRFSYIAMNSSAELRTAAPLSSSRCFTNLNLQNP